MPLTRNFLRRSYAKKSVSENGVCIYHSVNYRSCLWFLQHLCWNGDSLRQAVGTTSVLAAVRTIGGIYMFGRIMPVWSVVLVEFCFAYFMECIYGSPLSFKLACKNFDPKTTHPVLFETAIICATVGLMVPLMSLIATFLYYPYNNGFRIHVALVQWLRLMCFNFPFAFFTQLFLFSPLCELSSNWFSQKTLKTERIFSSPFLHQNQKFDKITKQQSRFDSSFT